MLIVSPASDLASGQYVIESIIGGHPVSVNNTIAALTPVERWVKTIQQPGGFSYDGFFALSQKQLGTYNERPIVEVTYRESGAFEELRQQLEVELKDVLAAPSLTDQIIFLEKVKTTFPDIYGQATETISARVETSLRDNANQGNFMGVIALGNLAKQHEVLTSQGLAMLAESEAEEHSFTAAEMEKLQWLRGDSEADSTEIARFETTSDRVIRPRETPFVMVTGRYTFQPPEDPMSQAHTMWHGYIVDITTQEDTSPWDGKVFFDVTTSYSQATHGGHSEETFKFAEKKTQEQFALALEAAKSQWKKDTEEFRLSTVLAPVSNLSPRVLVKDCHFKLSPADGIAVVTSRSYPNYVPADQVAGLSNVDWLQFRSTSNQPLKVTVERFP